MALRTSTGSIRFRAASDLSSNQEDVLLWLSQWPHVKAKYTFLITALRRRLLTGSHRCAKETIKFLELVLKDCVFLSTDQMMDLVRCVGREMLSAAPSELVNGNVIRRVLFFIREEYENKIKSGESPCSTNAISSRLQDLDLCVNENEPQSESLAPAIMAEVDVSDDSEEEEGGHDEEGGEKVELVKADDAIPCSEDSGTSADVAAPALMPPCRLTRGVSHHSNSSSSAPTHTTSSILKAIDFPGSLPASGPTSSSATPRSPSKYDRLSQTEFPLMFGDLNLQILEAVKEFQAEIDSMFGPICECSLDYVHENETILTYGYNKMVEEFVKAAAKKRRFHLIIAEGPVNSDGKGTNSGQNLAKRLVKAEVNQFVSLTVIPDSGIYAIMSRVNKVIFGPQAVMADGGSLCSSGHLMVAIAAKEYAVPLVGITGSYAMSPLFAHNQSTALGQLLSPTSVIQYNAPVDFENIEVMAPALDFVEPQFVSLYVTNNGCHLPSYIYRLLTEVYHPNDNKL